MGDTERKWDYEYEKSKIKTFLNEFYDESNESGKKFPYQEQIEQLAVRQQVALYVKLDDVQTHDPELVDCIRENTGRYHQLFSDVIDELISLLCENKPPIVLDALDAFIFQRANTNREQNLHAKRNQAPIKDTRHRYPPQLMRRFEIYFQPCRDEKWLAVREVKAGHIGKLISIKGVVIRSTEVKPMCSVITYTCDTCGCETYQPVNGHTLMPAVQCPSQDCTDTGAKGRLHMQVRGSKFVKFQEIRIQELSEQVAMGSIPRSLAATVTGENTRQAAPGDTVGICGVFLPQVDQSGFGKMTSGLLTNVFLETHYIENEKSNEEEELRADEELTDEETQLIAQPHFYDLLAHSIAPEIFGHTDVKKSLLLALVGGVDKNAAGMKIRGAINIILMGDPGVAKSQLLSHMDRLAARSQYTTGRGSSGVGLTAAVMRDGLTGEMTLEGGALVLADTGICCIDEFDKMIDTDRTAIHEVMEQQTVSIAKAGIMTSLNARVSIMAAANPAYGRYNPKRSVEQNIQLPAALLSRFDLLWLIQDKPDKEKDKRLAQHITYVHMEGHEPQNNGRKPLDMHLIRRYIALCKRKQPTVPEWLSERLVQMYVQLRQEANSDKRHSTFTSPRTLLAVIRCSTALARLRLGDIVQESDVEEAIRLMEASKDSLRPRLPDQSRKMEPIDAAFGVLRQLYQAKVDSSDSSISLNEALRKCINKGLNEDVLNNCIEYYQKAGVLMLDDNNRLVFTI